MDYYSLTERPFYNDDTNKSTGFNMMGKSSDLNVTGTHADDPYYVCIDCTMVMVIPPDELPTYHRGMRILLVISSLVACGFLLGTGFLQSL